MSVFSCQNCGAQSKKWAGRCSECAEWNSLVEESEISLCSLSAKSSGGGIALLRLQDVDANLAFDRVSSNIQELDNVLGGGFVTGSVVLLGGEPGIGKSTILLQIAHNVSKCGLSVAYASGEESNAQVLLRAQRMGIDVVTSGILLAQTGAVDDIIAGIDASIVKFLFIDSIQTAYCKNVSAPAGTISQIKATAVELISFAKQHNITLVLVAHLTKDGTISGPKLLEHLADVVVYFDSNNDTNLRMLRATKNRFGATNEIGVFTMEGKGLKEVSNPSSLFLDDHVAIANNVIFVAMEGIRPLLASVESLVAKSYIPIPKRSIVGWDGGRFGMIIAIMQTYCGISLHDKDVYLSMNGGFKTTEPANDLPVLISILLSYRKLETNKIIASFGEISLSGKVRKVPFIQNRLKEAIRMGYRFLIVPQSNDVDEFCRQENVLCSKVEIVQVRSVKEVDSAVRSCC